MRVERVGGSHRIEGGRAADVDLANAFLAHHADTVPDGWRDWLRFNEVTLPGLSGWRRDAAARESAMLEADQGRHLGFTRLTATKISPYRS